MPRRLLNDKHTVATLPRVCVRRPELVNRFQREEDKRVIFVSAPAGYGKTVSTQLWLPNSKRKHIWVGLDSYDNSPSIFYKLICAGILSLQFDNRAMDELYKSPLFTTAPVEYTIRLISEWIPDDKQYALVLDDVHYISNYNLIKSSLLVQKRLPLSFILVVLTRNKILEESLSIVGEGKYAIIDEEDLALSQAEIGEYFQTNGRTITGQEAAEIHAVTGGWAIGVKAMALSGKIAANPAGDRIWDVYFKEQIWDNWDEELREFILKTAIVDTMPIELCQKLTGREDAREVLETLLGDNTFISRLSEDQYCYHNLFLDFLRSQLPQSGLDVNALYKQAVDYYLEQGRLFTARGYAIKSADLESLVRVVYELTKYGSASLDDFAHFYKLHDPFSESMCDQAPFLYGMLMWENYLLGDVARMEYYMDKVYRFLPLIKEQFPEELPAILMQISLDHRVPIAGLAKRLDGFLSTIPADLRSATITHEMPFVHRSNRDYYELTDATLLSRMRDSLGLLFVEQRELFFSVLESGLFLEQNQPAKALKAILDAEKLLRESTGVELRFSVYIHLLAVYYDLCNPKYLEVLAEAEAFIERSGTNNLRPNFLAVKAKVMCWDGDKSAALEWLDHYFVADPEQFDLYKIYQYFTTARAYIVLGQTDKALHYLKMLRQLAVDFKRPLDLAEAGVLRAAVEWACGAKNDAQLTLEAVLQQLQPYRFARVVAIEGMAVLPILKRLTNKVRKENYQGPLDAEFLHEVTLAAYGQSKRHKGITVHVGGKSMALSKQQKLILTLLSRGYKYAEIARETGLTIHTVKSHASAAYAKLCVNNSMDAVTKAREMGLID